MDIELIEAGPEHAAALENLFQLYAYDFSEVLGGEVNDVGRFEPRSFERYWIDAWRHPFLIRANGRLAGFALVHQQSRLTLDPTVYDMAEFFVLRKYRRQRVGERAAALLFARFRGPWEVRELAQNQAAIAFWRKAIRHYTGDRFDEVTWDNEKWRGPVQQFQS